jgi:hypothetical protein
MSNSSGRTFNLGYLNPTLRAGQQGPCWVQAGREGGEGGVSTPVAQIRTQPIPDEPPPAPKKPKCRRTMQVRSHCTSASHAVFSGGGQRCGADACSRPRTLSRRGVQAWPDETVGLPEFT